MTRKNIAVGITAGDINGIGPEVTLKALRQVPPGSDVSFVIIGNRAVLAEQARAFRCPVPEPWDPAMGPPRRGVAIWDPALGQPLTWAPGKVRPEASLAAAEWIRTGTRACLDGRLDALVTAPICKEGFHRAGIHVPGHTEMLAALTKTRRYAMMLYGGPLRVVLATRHIPLAEVPSRITPALIREHVRLSAEALAWMGLRRRRIAVCGLNPHAGEGGDIGSEDIRIIAPAVRALKKKGYDVHGPLPGDTVFHQAAAGQYDLVLAMYHDQGLAPLKLIAFDSGVNVTLGLPVVRTSPDHGTAFDIAGRNLANPSSMAEAIAQAARLAQRGNPWKRHV